MAKIPTPVARSPGLRLAILIGVGLVCVAVIAALSLRGLPENNAPKAVMNATTPPAAELGSAVGLGRLAPSFDVVRVNPSGDTVIAGRAAPGAEVIIRQGGKEIGRTHADGRGEWVFLPSEPLPSGARELTLSARVGNGPEIAGAGSVVLVVPNRLPPGSLANMPLPPASLAVLSDATAAPRVLQGATTPGRLGLEAVEYDNQGQLRFAGTAPPGAHVRIYIDNGIAGEAIADSRGVWSLLPSGAVAPGPHRLRLDQLGADGKIAAHADYPFQRETITGDELADGKIVVRPGNSLWTLARNRYGQGTRYTVIYEANRARLNDPDKIFPGQILALPPSSSGKSR